MSPRPAGFTNTRADEGGSTRPSPGGDEMYDIVIVGYGPAGATAANLAVIQGMRIAVIERDIDVFPRQRAITADDEVMRIFQTIGIVDRIRETMHEGATSQFVTAKGKTLMSLRSAITHNGYHQRNFFHQPYMEKELRKGVERYPELVDFFLGHDAVEVENGPDSASVSARNKVTGETVQLRGRYVFACDGGSSAIRKALGFPMEGKSLPDPWFDVQGEALQPTKDTPYFKFICDPNRAGVDCPAPAGMHRYEWRINPGESAEEMKNPKKMWEVVSELSAKANGDPGRKLSGRNLDVKRTWEYTFHVRRAAQWRVGRILLLGDAAHLMPAFAGTGMAAAIRDTVNATWKVKAVLDGRADESLLDTYQVERGHHVEAITAYAEKLGRIVQARNPLKVFFRDVYYQTISQIPGLKAYTTTMKGKPVPGFPDGFIAKSGKKKTPVGRTFPNVDVGTDQGRMLLDDYVGYTTAIFGLNEDPRELLPADVVEAWEKWGARFITIRPGTLVVGTDEVGDAVGRLWEWFQDNGKAQVAIVRPDRIVYGIDSEGVDLSPKHAATSTLTSAEASTPQPQYTS